MPIVTLSSIESQVVLLAAQKKAAAERSAQRLVEDAAMQFSADILLIQDAHPEIPTDQPVKWDVVKGLGTATWPDRPGNAQ